LSFVAVNVGKGMHVGMIGNEHQHRCKEDR
jgi:hypothetical protein